MGKHRRRADRALISVCVSSSIGEPIMAGDGPWHVSQVDSYTSLANPEGDNGVSTFTIIDVAGTPMIDMHARVSNN